MVAPLLGFGHFKHSTVDAFCNTHRTANTQRPLRLETTTRPEYTAPYALRDSALQATSSHRSRPATCTTNTSHESSLECSSPIQDAQRLLDWRSAHRTTSLGEDCDRKRAEEAVGLRSAAGQSSEVEHVLLARGRCCLLRRAQRLEASPPTSRRHSTRSGTARRRPR